MTDQPRDYYKELLVLFPTRRMCTLCGLGEKYPSGCFCGACRWVPVDSLGELTGKLYATAMLGGPHDG